MARRKQNKRALATLANQVVKQARGAFIGPLSKRATQRKARKRKGKGGGAMVMNGALAHQICAITDPFCKAAIGSKIPDSGSTKTLSWDADQWITATTDAQGRAAVFCSVDPGSYVCVATAYTGVTGNAVNLVSTPLPAPGFINFTSSNVSVNWRCVSSGVSIRSIMSSMNNQGSIGIAALPAAINAQVVSGTNVFDLDSTLFAENVRISANMGSELSAISRPDAITNRIFKAPTTPAPATFTTAGNETLVAYIVGGPASTACIQIRLTTHYELEFTNNTIFNQLATPQAQDNPAAMAGSNFVNRTVDRIIVGGTKEVEKRVYGAAEAFGRWAAKKAAQSVGAMIGGPVGFAAASNMIMDM